MSMFEKVTDWLGRGAARTSPRWAARPPATRHRTAPGAAAALGPAHRARAREARAGRVRSRGRFTR